MQLGCVTSHRPGKLFVGHLLEVTARMPCVFQDPWALVPPSCQAEGGTVMPSLDAHSGMCGPPSEALRRPPGSQGSWESRVRDGKEL